MGRGVFLSDQSQLFDYYYNKHYQTSDLHDLTKPHSD